jgi:predicted ATPase
MSKNFYVITGGPGAGKTTLINELRKKGFTCMEEVARRVIQQQVKLGGDALPWSNILRYKELLLAHTLESYTRALQENKKLVFFDRGVLDLIAYDRRTKTESSQALKQAIHELTYNETVFVTPPWKEIFCNDSERKQTYEEAVDVYKGIVAVYAEHGYHLVEMPKLTISGRVKFLLDYVR